jgi:hypothetical protein
MSRAPEHVTHAMKPEFDGTGLNDNLEPNGSGCHRDFDHSSQVRFSPTSRPD